MARITSKPASADYRDNYDRIFGPKAEAEKCPHHPLCGCDDDTRTDECWPLTPPPEAR